MLPPRLEMRERLELDDATPLTILRGERLVRHETRHRLRECEHSIREYAELVRVIFPETRPKHCDDHLEPHGPVTVAFSGVKTSVGEGDVLCNGWFDGEGCASCRRETSAATPPGSAPRRPHARRPRARRRLLRPDPLPLLRVPDREARPKERHHRRD